MSKDDQNKQFHYLPTLAAAGPVFAAKSIVGDMSKASIEHTVESKLLGSHNTVARLLAQGARGKGLGRVLGGVLGVATAPAFIRGTQLLGSKDRNDRLKGLGVIGGATVGYAGAKGFLENFAKAKQLGMSPAAAASKGLLLGAVRSGYKLPLALATAWSVAQGRKKDEGGHSGAGKFLIPIATGAGAGAIGRAVEEAAEQATHRGLSMETRLRRLAAAGGGGAVGGALGGALLAGAVDVTSRVLAGKKKESSLRKHAFTGFELLLVPKALGLMAGAAKGTAAAFAAMPFAAKAALAGKGALVGGKALGMNLLHAEGVGIPLHATTGAAFGYRNGAAGLVRDLMPRKTLTSMEHAANTARARQLSFGIKDGLLGRASPGFGAEAISNFTVPELAVQRQMGTRLGRALRDVPEAKRAATLRGIQALILSRPNMLKGTGGEPNEILAPLVGGISMALGDREHYAGSGKLNQAWQSVALPDHLRARGLPTELGKLQKEKGYFGRNAVHLSMSLGAVLGTATGFIPHNTALELAVGHGAWGGGKNAIVDLPALHAKLQRDSHGGLRHGIFPNAFVTKGQQRVSDAMDLILSPATSTPGRAIKPIARTLHAEALEKGFSAIRQQLGRAGDRVMAPRHPSATRVLAQSAGGALAGAGLLGLATHQYRKDK